MKDSEFIELLNLYLDHEISAEDSARLEEEVARSSERLRLYRQYCRMQRACVKLAEKHREGAPAQDAVAAAFAPRPVWAGAAALWTTGLLAAAAGIAVVAISHRSAVAPSGPGLVQQAPAAPALASAPVKDEFKPVFVARDLALDGGSPKAGAIFASPALIGRFAWMNRVQIAPLQLAPDDSLIMDPKPQLDLDDRPAGDRTQSADGVEETAFQFRK